MRSEVQLLRHLSPPPLPLNKLLHSIPASGTLRSPGVWLLGDLAGFSQSSSGAFPPHSPGAARERPGGSRPGKLSLAAAGRFSAAPGLQPGC